MFNASYVGMVGEQNENKRSKGEGEDLGGKKNLRIIEGGTDSESPESRREF